MDTLLYYVVGTVLKLIQSLPISLVARLGRIGGGIAYWLDARHRRVAFANMKRSFGSNRSDAEIRCLVQENFKRIGENFASAIKTSSMPHEEIKKILEVAGAEHMRRPEHEQPPRSGVFAVGHFGNFELYPRVDKFLGNVPIATTYRGLRQPSMNRLMQEMRNKSGCQCFERRTGIKQLQEAMNNPALALGLFSDQHAGDRGLRLPFFGEDCSTSAAPAVFALRYHRPLYTSICYRVAPARWRIEFGPEIPTHENGSPRSIEAIMLDVNRAFEAAVLRDPANWFWVHNRWKAKKYRPPVPVQKNPLSKSADDDMNGPSPA